MRKKIALVLGGKSAEREISLLTGEQVGLALRQKGLGVVALDLDQDLPLALVREKPDVVFIALHGRYGGGRLPSGIPRDPRNSLCWVRCACKRTRYEQDHVQEALQVRRPPVSQGDRGQESTIRIEQTWRHSRRQVGSVLGYPVVVKPNTQGVHHRAYRGKESRRTRSSDRPRFRIR